mgnify:CR=1 FL=1
MRKLTAWWARRVGRTDDPGWRLYRSLAAQAVAPEQFRVYGLADTPETRFELLALHMAAAWARLGVGPEAVRALKRPLGEAFVADMDASLRDLGAGDLGVGRRVKALAERLYGRLAAYAPALAADADAGATRAALARNLYKEGAPDDAVANESVVAAQALAAAWRALPDTQLLKGEAP